MEIKISTSRHNSWWVVLVVLSCLYHDYLSHLLGTQDLKNILATNSTACSEIDFSCNSVNRLVGNLIPARVGGAFGGRAFMAIMDWNFRPLPFHVAFVIMTLISHENVMPCLALIIIVSVVLFGSLSDSFCASILGRFFLMLVRIGCLCLIVVTAIFFFLLPPSLLLFLYCLSGYLFTYTSGYWSSMYQYLLSVCICVCVSLSLPISTVNSFPCNLRSSTSIFLSYNQVGLPPCHLSAVVFYRPFLSQCKLWGCSLGTSAVYCSATFYRLAVLFVVYCLLFIGVCYHDFCTIFVANKT